jgi:hypothetical protein
MILILEIIVPRPINLEPGMLGAGTEISNLTSEPPWTHHEPLPPSAHVKQLGPQQAPGLEWSPNSHVHKEQTCHHDPAVPQPSP